ncbi:nuclease-related domain-containing protein [Nonomuraea spiralis]|uniref:nuclease-related domain-containing protein n=1 Tax=Nonomuraea spiralis TaxID=46182 RepID=UPI00379859E2
MVTMAWNWHAGRVAALVMAAFDTVRRWRVHSPAAAWRKGAVGERATARRLRSLEAAGYTVLHDRRLPRSRANLDHLVIGPCGVVVVDSKRWRRKTRISRRRGQVWIGRRPAQAPVKSAAYEAHRVAELLRAAGWNVNVTAVLAVHGARLPRWGATRFMSATKRRQDWDDRAASGSSIGCSQIQHRPRHHAFEHSEEPLAVLLLRKVVFPESMHA